MKNSGRSHRAIAAAGIGALIGATLEQQEISAAADTPPISTEAGQRPIKSTKNDVGCVRIDIPSDFPAGGPEGWNTIFRRPSDLDVEKLSDKELDSCGLLLRGNARQGTKEYDEWLRVVKLEMKARQPTPWEARPRLFKGPKQAPPHPQQESSVGIHTPDGTYDIGDDILSNGAPNSAGGLRRYLGDKFRWC